MFKRKLSALAILCMLTLVTNAQIVVRKSNSLLLENTILNESFFRNVTSLPTNKEVSISLAPSLTLNGLVVENKMLEYNIRCVIIRCMEPIKGLFMVYQITGKDGTLSYTGRIINTGEKFSFKIKNIEGHYHLQKVLSSELLSICPLP